MRHVLKLLALTLTVTLTGGLALLAAPPASAAGRFIYVEGPVSVRDAAGISREVRAGDALNEREAVTVGSGRAQIRFDDGGWMSLQPNTIFEVKSFPRADEGNVVLALIKGGARAVTGLISRRQPQRYLMETPTATIGIRGTSFQVTFCQQSCDLPDGLYVTGGDGTIFVKNGFGEIDLSRGRTAYVANAQTPPRESSVKPMAAVAEPASVQQMATAGSTNPAELRPGNFIYTTGTNGFVGPFTVTPITTAGLAAAASGTLSAAASGVIRGIFESATGTGTGAGSGGGVGTVGPGFSLTVTSDSLQRPVSFSVTDAVGRRVSGSALSAPEVFGNDGALFWGRWTNTTFQLDVSDPAVGSATGTATLGAGSYLHYMVGLPGASMPLSGSATYGFIGGSGSTSTAGTIGAGVTAGTLTANFGSNTVGASLSISHGGTYSASGFGFLQAGNRAQFESVSGSASGPTGTHGFEFGGFFSGAGAPTAPARAGLGFTINRPDPIVGTAGFACKTGC